MRRSLLLVMLMCLPRLAAAQQVPSPEEDPVANARLHFGAIALTPRFTISDFGIDSNVFNTLDDAERDFTFATKPGADVWMRTGRGLLTLSGDVELIYFQTFDTQRAFNSNARAQYEFRFNRMRPFVSGSTLNTKQRPGYEIDARARWFETEFTTGNDLRVASKSVARIEFRSKQLSFAGDAVFAGRPLNQELNRTVKAVELGWRQRLTALTTWIVRVSRETERFEFETARNGDSFRLSSGFELGRFALIRGRAFVGYRKLRPADGGILPPFTGVTSDVDVTYTAPSQTRLSFLVDRDIQYSYDVSTPYYVQTGWTGKLTQRIIGRWDAQITGGRDRLAYQSARVTAVGARTDFVGRFGGGVGYAVNDQMRVSFDVNSFYRRSNIRGREYGAIRGGLSVTYGY
jgi:hypothetical protein